jgi:arylsulfatase A-like enzyme
MVTITAKEIKKTIENNMINFINKHYVIVLFFAGINCFYSCSKKEEKPNVVIIYSDDIGYGDIGVYGAELIPTPNIDRLASEGIRFTDGHCGASTCSPSRYALLTGEMGFRKNVGIQPVNAPVSIQPTQFTIGKLFQKAGYHTGIIGKWHLGLGDGDINWNKEIKPGPNEVGFDYSFIIPSSNDRSPFVYVENHKVYNHDSSDPITVSREPIPDSIQGTKYPDAIKNPESVTVYGGDKNHRCTVINGVGRIGYMKGGAKAVWNDNDIADNLVEKAEKFIYENANNPFFLLLSTNDIHAPRLPHPRFKGATNLSYRGDNIVQLDWCVGEIMKILRQKGIEKNTILVFTSDNGPVYIDGGYEDESDKGTHKAAGIFRGGKYQIYEGGTRVPFIIKWPSTIEPKVSSALISQVDLLASFAAFFNLEIPVEAALDSRNHWDAFIGKDDVGANVILEQTNSKRSIAIRKGKMKYLNKPGDKYEMYNLEIDPEEKNNIIEEYPELAEKLHLDLIKLREIHLNNYYNN